MATAIYVPRINNNDDEVKVLSFEVGVGDKVNVDQIIGQVETDKAVLDVTASSEGYVLGFVASPEEVVRVGTIMLWLGERKDEAIPEVRDTATAQSTTPVSQVTAKARILLEDVYKRQSFGFGKFWPSNPQELPGRRRQQNGL